MPNPSLELTFTHWKELAELFTARGDFSTVSEALKTLHDKYYIARFEQIELGRGLYCGEFFVVQEVLFRDLNGTVSPSPFLVVRDQFDRLILLDEQGLPERGESPA